VPYSKVAADAAVNFFELVLKHTQDEYYGKPFILAPWQEEAVRAIFGQVDEDGNRIIETVYLEVPKKTGKTEWAAGLLLLILVLTMTPSCQIYGAAAATRQAMNVYRAACKMVEQSPLLQARLLIRRGTNRIVKRNDPDSFYAAVAADGDMGDGVNPVCTVADEVHRWKTRKQMENWDVLSNGGITRKQTLTVAITTAGVKSESPLAWQLHELTRRIKEGIVTDPKFFGRIYGADRTDDPGDPKTWIKAIPSLKENGGFLDIEKVREKYVSAVAKGDLTSFKRYFLNMWEDAGGRAIDMAKWEASSGDWVAEGLLEQQPDFKARSLPHELKARFIGRRCWAGVDMSTTTDLTAVSLLFPREDEGFDVLPFFYLPDAKIKLLQTRLGVPLRQWAEQGWIELIPGEAIDHRIIRARLEWAAELFDLQEICFDPWNSREISLKMLEDGHRCEEIRQGFATLNEPSKKLIELVLTGRLNHGGHPIMRWNASCVSSRELNDNVMFEKPKRATDAARIDGIAATVNALQKAMAATSNLAAIEVW
jgi:phage terminase large subunit-like protein